MSGIGISFLVSYKKNKKILSFFSFQIDQKCLEDTITKIIHDLKCHFYVMNKFCDFLNLRPSGIITTLTYVLMNNFYY